VIGGIDMNEIIAKSYRTAGILIDSDMMQKREKSINSYVNDIFDEKDIAELIKLFFEKRCNQQFLNNFIEVFVAEDNLFADDQKNELQVLAGIVLNQICEYEDVDALFKMKVYTNSYVFIGRTPILENVYQNIHQTYEKIAARNRDDIIFEYNSISEMPEDVSFEVNEGEDYEISGEDTRTFISMIDKINELCAFINKNYKDIMNKNKILYENTELLWWLQAGFSGDEQKAYLELLDKQAAILVGKDLAEIVQYKPGPYLAKNLLYRALAEHGRNKYLFKEYIDICDDNTIETLINGKEDKINTPVLYALNKKLETGEGNWIKAFEKNFGSSELEYVCTEIAYQMYLECLLLKW
jgi:hypothetical protein